MNTTVYPSKIDTWLWLGSAAATLGSMAVTLPLMIWVPGPEVAVTVAVLLLGAALPWWILASTRYTVSDESLLIRSGPFRWTVPLRDIVSITETRSPLSSPALSLDRLRIERTGGRPILISPSHRQRFLEDLRARGAAGVPAP